MMFKFAVAALAWFVNVVLLLPAPTLSERMNAAAHKFEIMYNGQVTAVCSAMAYAPGKIITAKHCYDGENAQYWVDGIRLQMERVDKDTDLALFRIKWPSDAGKLTDTMPLSFRHHEVPVGTEIVVVAWPLGELRIEEYGMVMGERSGDLAFSIHAIPGMSGSSLVNVKTGEIVAITSYLLQANSQWSGRYGDPILFGVPVYNLGDEE